jgi:hypothetical protein
MEQKKVDKLETNISKHAYDIIQKNAKAEGNSTISKPL